MECGVTSQGYWGDEALTVVDHDLGCSYNTPLTNARRFLDHAKHTTITILFDYSLRLRRIARMHQASCRFSTNRRANREVHLFASEVR
jgi:hypothetical protein